VIAVEEVGALRVEMSLTSAEFKKGLQDVNNRLKIAQSEFRLAGAGIKDFGKTMDGMKAKSRYLEQSLQSQQQKVQHLRQRYEQLKNTKGEDDAATQRMLIAYNNAQAAVQRTESELQGLNRTIEIQSSRWTQLGTRLNAVGERFQKVGAGLKTAGQSLSQYVTLPLLGVGAVAIKAAADFDKANATIRAGTGATGKALQDLNDDFKTVLKQVPQSSDVVSTAIADLNTRIGLAGKPLQEITKQMLNLSKVTGIDVSSLITDTTRVFGDWGIATEKQAETLDYLWKVSQTTGIGVDQLSQKVVQFGAPLRQLGFTFEKSAALFGKWEKEGVNAELVMGGMRIALGKMAKAGEEPTKVFPKLIEQIQKAGTVGEANTLALEAFGAKAGADMAAAIREGRFGIEDLLATLNGSTETINKAGRETLTLGERMAMLKNKAQVGIAPLGKILIDLGEKHLPKLVSGVEKLSKWFSDLGPKGQKNVLMYGAMAAAIGPVLVAAGTLIGSIGTIVTGLGGLATAIGASGGLLAAMTGPIGVVVAGLTLGTAAVVGLTKASKENNVVSFKTLEARQKEIESNDELIKNYDLLRVKNQLSNDEMLRFLDIQSEINSTVDPGKIAALKDEQDKLLQKSGLTNDEMETFLDYNDKIIEKAPNTAKAISEQGNAYAKNADELRNVNAEKLKSLKIDAEKAINDNIQKENKLLADQTELRKGIAQDEKDREEAYKNVNALAGEIAAKEKEVAELSKDRSRHGQEVLAQAQLELENLQKAKEREETKRDLLIAQMQVKQDSLEATQEELQKLDKQKFKYEEIILAMVGLTAEKGKGLAAVQLELAKLEHQKTLLKDLLKTGEINTAEYQEQVSAIDAQISKLEEAHDELKGVNETAGKTVYKDIVISDAPLEVAKELNEILGRTINKRVIVNQTGPNIAKYAASTRNVPGGFILLGEGL
jgi:TP901 family phage tail tape measure protein